MWVSNSTETNHPAFDSKLPAFTNAETTRMGLFPIVDRFGIVKRSCAFHLYHPQRSDISIKNWASFSLIFENPIINTSLTMSKDTNTDGRIASARKCMSSLRLESGGFFRGALPIIKLGSLISNRQRSVIFQLFPLAILSFIYLQGVGAKDESLL